MATSDKKNGQWRLIYIEGEATEQKLGSEWEKVKIKQN